MSNATPKPLNGKAYGFIGHLPTSRLGPGDHSCHEGQSRICTEKLRDKNDRIIVQEKSDGSCVAVAKVLGKVLALTRAGYIAATSPYVQHHIFGRWVESNASRFDGLLSEGERVCGEWLAQAHGTRYELPHEPFVAFDIMRGSERSTYDRFSRRASRFGFTTAGILHVGSPLPIEAALYAVDHHSYHGAIDPVEGAVWRVERKGRDGVWAVDFLAKFVREGKADGSYLPEISGKDAVWNWTPEGGAVPLAVSV